MKKKREKYKQDLIKIKSRDTLIPLKIKYETN